jgi:hypothetical protein
MFKVIKERTYNFKHDDGTESPVDQYTVIISGTEFCGTKKYTVEVGCKKSINDGINKTYVWSSNGRFCEPSKKIHKIVSHWLHNAIACNIVEEGEAA